MRLRQLHLREIRMPLLAPFETSFGRTTERRILLLELETSDGVAGWSEVTAGENPFYSAETMETAWHILRDFIWPLVRGREVVAASGLVPLMSPVRGNLMAKAGLECAAWDAEARAKNLPLWRMLGGTRPEIPCGVSISIHPTIEALLAKVESDLAAGYQRVKIKIKPGWDVDPSRALRERFPRIRLLVDANSAYSLADTAHLKQLDDFYLIMIEQPLGHDDIYSHSLLRPKLQTPLCLDECIETEADMRAAIALKACEIVNIKLGRVGGYTFARRIHDLCRDNGIPVWCGGMLESGIGRAHNIAMSTLENFTLPGDVSASSRYWDEDIIAPEVEVTSRGTIIAPDRPGIGFEPRLDRIVYLTVREELLT
jgi:O-succinylbenzoate synthase